MATRMQNDDASQIHDMLLSAKRGEWDVVFDILEDKPYLVNCISSDRAWGVLHQAAWMNSFPVVQYLLRIPGCDPTIKTKQDSAREHGPGKSPRDLSTNRGIHCLFRLNSWIASWNSEKILYNWEVIHPSSLM